MASIEDMMVRLDASTGRMETKLDAATRRIDQFETKVNRRLKKVDSGFTKLGSVISRQLLPVLGAAGLGRAVSDAVSSLANLKDTADKLGISVERLQEIRYAAQEVGLSTQTADLAMQRFIRRVGEAQNGAGELKGVLQEYNVTLFDSNGNMRDAGDVLKDLADLIGTTEDAQERLRIAFKAFDSEGVQFVNVLKDGSAGLDKMAQRARELGIVIDSETAAKAKEFDSLWLQLTQAGSSRFKAFTISVLADFQPMVSRLIQQTETLRTAFDNLRNVGGQVASLEGEVKANYTVADFGGDNYLGSGYNEFVKDLQAQMDALSGDFSLLPDIPAPPETPQKKQDQQRESREREAEEIVRLEQEKQEAITATVAALQFRNEQVQRSAADQELYNQLQQAGVALDSEEGQQIKNLVDQYYNLADAKELDKKRSDELNSAAQDLGFTFSSAFEDAIVNGEQLSDVLKGLLQDIARIVLRKAVVEPLTDSISSGLSSVLPGFASGGDPAIGKPAIVGENGPELIVPRTAQTVIPNHALGGSTFNQSITIDARGASGFAQQQLEQMKAEIVRDTKKAIAASANRGGSFAKAMGRRS